MIVVLMGVAGSGKTTVGNLLAAQLGWRFLDADDFHSPANVEKMGRGAALTDADREPWLQSLMHAIREIDGRGESAVLACSALRESFRERLKPAAADMRFVHLATDFHTIEARIAHRSGHYFGPELLRSQFDTLELPADAIVVDAALPPATIVNTITPLLLS